VDLYYEQGEQVRFKVKSFETVGEIGTDFTEEGGKRVEFVGDMSEDGLGPVTWWTR